MITEPVNKVVLAYSGGLDTSVILKWLQDTYHCEVVTFTADIGQGEEVSQARAKAESLGVKEIFVEDLVEEFVRDYVFPMFRANTIYEGEYLLGTSIARPLVAKRLVEIAGQTGAGAISHGATGKGNDQVRLEMGAYALKPDIRVIAPWREWDLDSRQKLLAYAERHGIPIEAKRAGSSPYSMDANLLHISYEGGDLEDPWQDRTKPYGAGAWRRSKRPMSRKSSNWISKTAMPAPWTGCHDTGTVVEGAERNRRQARHRPDRHCREPLRGHEIPGLL